MYVLQLQHLNYSHHKATFLSYHERTYYTGKCFACHILCLKFNSLKHFIFQCVEKTRYLAPVYSDNTRLVVQNFRCITYPRNTDKEAFINLNGVIYQKYRILVSCLSLKCKSVNLDNVDTVNVSYCDNN